MEPWEVMISESQERMIAIVRPQMLEAVEAVLDRWELDARGDRRGHGYRSSAGALGRRGRRRDSRSAAHRRVPALRGRADAAPGARTARDRRRAAGGRRARRARRLARYPQPRVRVPPLRPARRLAHGSPAWPRCGGAPAAAVACGGSRSRSTARAASPDLDPFTGGALAALEAARNVACVGGEPIGFTDCLNFGNPEKPEIGWELAQAIDGIAAACEALDIPVVSGNVSLYNETNGRAIHPTPVVGAVGLVEDVRRVPKGWRAGDVLSPRSRRPSRSPGRSSRRGTARLGGTPPPLDLEAEARLVSLLWHRRTLGDARPRRVRGRARGVSRRGGARVGLRRGARSARRPRRAVR